MKVFILVSPAKTVLLSSKYKYFPYYFRAHKDKIFEVRWDSNNVDKLATVGVRHIKFWTQTGGGLTAKRGTFGNIGKAETMMCITYPKVPGVVISGAASGLIYIWNDEVLKSTVQAHQGPVFAIHALEKVPTTRFPYLTIKFTLRYYILKCRPLE